MPNRLAREQSGDDDYMISVQGMADPEAEAEHECLDPGHDASNCAGHAQLASARMARLYDAHHLYAMRLHVKGTRHCSAVRPCCKMQLGC